MKKLPWTDIYKKYKIYSKDKKAEIEAIYDEPDNFENAVAENPYDILILGIGKTFKKADELILELFPDLRDSYTRCKWIVWSLLKDNEQDGDTCIDANVLAKALKQDYAEVYSHVVEVIKTDELFYYEPKGKMVAIRATYEAEKRIAEEIKTRVANPVKLDIDWGKYTAVDGLVLTDEQIEVLKLACSESVMMLNGAAGCVDADTEFFTGKGWKRIADYNIGDNVLQYNEDGTAKLVDPIAYIKKPCDTLWHFETKYGINQTVCDEHRIVYWSKKGFKHECSIKDIIDKQSSNGWRGKFETAFTYGGNGIGLTDDEIRVMCAVICDGSFSNTTQNSNRCRFHLKKERKKERILELCKKANIDITIHESTAESYTDYYIYAPIKTKVFDECWYNCNNHQLKIICDEIIFWDGNANETKNGVIRKRYNSNVKENADFIQFAFSACGYRASISEVNRVGRTYFTCGKEYVRKSKEYNVIITNKHMVGLCCDNRKDHTKTKIEKVNTIDGYKYCFTVPSHMLVLRKKNCVFITGNCGKTTVVEALVKMLSDNGKSVTCVAPTGIAAKRLQESAKHEASTIHRFLASKKQIGDFLIIDEASILGVVLLAKLLRRVYDDTKIVFICDSAQLCSISCGNIVQDIIDSGIMPTVTLTKVFRYGKGGIATVSTDARNGRKLNEETSFNDYTFIQANKNIKEKVMESYRGLLTKYSQDDIVIISPFNVHDAGTYAINSVIQREYNSNPVLVSYNKTKSVRIDFKKDDIILNTENNYRAHGEYGDIAIMNGEKGVVLGYENGYLKVQYESGIAYLENESIWKQLLGYCITGHKIQGNQAKAVIVVLDKSHGFFLTRNLIYVMLSRAMEKLIVIGDIGTINSSLDKEENKVRNTWLKELLIK